MTDKILYPQNIENLFLKLEYIVKNEQNPEKIQNIENWIIWFKKNDFVFEYKLKENEYLSYYNNDNTKALQVWKHNECVDNIVFNILSNTCNEFNYDETIIIF